MLRLVLLPICCMQLRSLYGDHKSRYTYMVTHRTNMLTADSLLAQMTVRDALNSAMDEEMEKDKDVFILGEEVRL